LRALVERNLVSRHRSHRERPCAFNGGAHDFQYALYFATFGLDRQIKLWGSAKSAVGEVAENDWN